MLPDSGYLATKLRILRHSITHVDALPQLSFIALIIGACTGLIIVVFRLALESAYVLFEMQHADDFESLTPISRIALIMGGSLIIGIALIKLNKYQRQMSVSHVIDRLHNHQGNLPFSNWLAQLLLAIVAIVSGHGVGREGPAVHLGAGAASFVGRWMRLPNNSMQTLIACGVAAGIAASFDTPLAGVIFAMEVIVMEYTIIGFVPVILASVIGSAICKSILGESVVFHRIDSSMNSMGELGLVLLAGLTIAVAAGGYIRLHLFSLKFSKMPILIRILIAGVLTSGVAIFVPEVMGLGYDTIQQVLSGNIVASSILLIALAKFIVAPIATGLGVPGGLIGPAIFIGACLGAALGAAADILIPSMQVDISLYVLLCMTGMMAAVINAPLAALIAILELSQNPNIIFPAMLMIVISNLTVRQVFKVRSIFTEQLTRSGRDIEMGAASRTLRTTSVMRIMDRNFTFAECEINIEQAKDALNTKPRWVLFIRDEEYYALWAPDLAHFMSNLPEDITKDEAPIKLNEVPGRRHIMQPILESESLLDALNIMNKKQSHVLYVSSRIRNTRSVHGIVTLDAVKNHYQPKEIKSALG